MTTKRAKHAALPSTDSSPRERIAAMISEITAEAVRLSGTDTILVDASYSASSDGFSLKVAQSKPAQRHDDQQHAVLFEQHLSLCGYGQAPDDTQSAEREAIIILSNWLGYLNQLEQQLAA